MKRDILIALAIFAVGLWHNLAYVDTTKFHRDEARWVGRAYFWDELRHPGSETWEDGYLTRGQPPLGSILMGLGLTLQGRDTTTTRNRELYDFNHAQSWNRLYGRIPAQADIDAGRRTNAVVGALLGMVVFWIGRRLINRVAGVAGALLLLVHPLHVYLSSLAGSDALLAFLVALAALIALYLAERPSWLWTTVLGVVLGLGASTKLSPLLLAFLVAGVGVVLLLNGKPWRSESDEATQRRDLGWMLLTTPLVAFATFVASYPYLWPDPLERTKVLFTFRANEMESQGSLWDDRLVTGVPDAISHVQLRIGEQLTSSTWLADRVGDRFGFTWDLPWLDLALGTAGLGVLTLLAIIYGVRSRYTFALMILGGQTLITIVGMEVDFERYHLPIAVAVAVGFGVLAGQGWVLAVTLARRGSSLAARRASRAASTAPEAATAERPALRPADDATVTAPRQGQPGVRALTDRL